MLRTACVMTVTKSNVDREGTRKARCFDLLHARTQCSGGHGQKLVQEATAFASFFCMSRRFSAAGILVASVQRPGRRRFSLVRNKIRGFGAAAS